MRRSPEGPGSIGESVVLNRVSLSSGPAVGSPPGCQGCAGIPRRRSPRGCVTASLPGETGIRITEDSALLVHPVTLLPTPGKSFCGSRPGCLR